MSGGLNQNLSSLLPLVPSSRNEPEVAGVKTRNSNHQRLEARFEASLALVPVEKQVFQGDKNLKTGTNFIIRDTA